MKNILKVIYKFLFQKHSCGFFRFCMAMLLPCAFSAVILYIWLYVLALLEVLIIYAQHQGWTKEVE